MVAHAEHVLKPVLFKQISNQSIKSNFVVKNQQKPHIERASSLRPMLASASMYQNVQILKA
jgi:hypothetical protein